MSEREEGREGRCNNAVGRSPFIDSCYLDGNEVKWLCGGDLKQILWHNLPLRMTESVLTMGDCQDRVTFSKTVFPAFRFPLVVLMRLCEHEDEFWQKKQ